MAKTKLSLPRHPLAEELPIYKIVDREFWHAGKMLASA
jgi:hypothetical protein